MRSLGSPLVDTDAGHRHLGSLSHQEDTGAGESHLDILPLDSRAGTRLHSPAGVIDWKLPNPLLPAATMLLLNISL